MALSIGSMSLQACYCKVFLQIAIFQSSHKNFLHSNFCRVRYLGWAYILCIPFQSSRDVSQPPLSCMFTMPIYLWTVTSLYLISYCIAGKFQGFQFLRILRLSKNFILDFLLGPRSEKWYTACYHYSSCPIVNTCIASNECYALKE